MNDMNRIAQITQRVAQKFDASKEAIDRGEREAAQERYVAIYVAKADGFDPPTIARYFDCAEATVYRALRIVEERIENEVLLRVQINSLLGKKDDAGTESDEVAELPAEDSAPVSRPEENGQAAAMSEPAPVHELATGLGHPVVPAATNEALPDFDGTKERTAGPGPRREAATARRPVSRVERIKERLREKGILPRETVVQSWEDTPVVKVRERELTIEVEDVGSITIPGHVALGSLKAVSIQRTARILQALQDGRFRIDGA